MQREWIVKHCIRLFLVVLTAFPAFSAAYGDSCTTQAQMTAAQREDYAQAAHLVAADIQNGDLQRLRDDTLPAAASDFSGIEQTAEALRPQIEQAGITVDSLYGFEALAANGNNHGAQFFCSLPGSPMTVVLTLSNLPPGAYVLAILHATGVPKPQQISLLLAETPGKQWKLAGIFSRPLMMAGQNGVWYWSHARNYAQRGMDWAAWFYYRIADFLVQPASFLSSPNLDRLRQETERVHPQNLPGDRPITLSANGYRFDVTRVDTTAELGPLDLAVHYSPDATEAVELRNPAAARRQVVNLMAGILALHPELREAFNGMWVYADEGTTTAFALELPMNEIPGGAQASESKSNSAGL